MHLRCQVIVSLIGPDGAGKSTLASGLKQELSRFGIDVVTLHAHQWWHNAFVLPVHLFSCRKLRRVVILDRCILDNGVELSRKLKLRKTIRMRLLTILSIWGRIYDVRILVIAPVSVLASRRPDEPRAKLVANYDIYTEAAQCALYTTVSSVEPTVHIGVEAVILAAGIHSGNNN